ncbi:MAG TPA: alpha/beta hydrolase [Acidimicrobiales bacterium]
MDTISSFDGTEIAYAVEGHGPPVLLLHGFAADHQANWVAPGIVNALIGAERQVIATDARGHGRSGKPHDPTAYDGDAMVRDAQAVLDHLGVTEVDVVGYSMGAMVSARLVSVDSRARSVVLGGVGGNLTPPTPAAGAARIADALEVEDPSTITDPVGRGFRAFADTTGADRLALAAIERSTSLRQPVDFAAITVPALVLVGDNDALVGQPQALADRLADVRVVIVPGDHLTAVAAPEFAPAIEEFLDLLDAESDAAIARALEHRPD